MFFKSTIKILSQIFTFIHTIQSSLMSSFQVKPGSIAEKVGLRLKDSLVKIGNDSALEVTIEEANESLKKGKDFFDMIVER